MAKITRAKLLGLDTQFEKIKKTEKATLDIEKFNVLMKRIRTTQQRMNKIEESLNKHRKRLEMLRASLRTVCKHQYLPMPFASESSRGDTYNVFICKVCGARKIN